MVVLAGIFAACLLALYQMADLVFEDKDTAFDDRVFAFIVPYINGANTAFMQTITFFGSVQFLLPAMVLLIGYLWWLKKLPIDALKIAVIFITGTAVLFLLKFILQRQRPLTPLIARVHGYSFPSGHSFSAVMFYGILGYIGYRFIKNNWLKWGLFAVLFLFAALIGFSRIYLKLHYASDVVAGFCLGIIWLLLAKWLLFSSTKPITQKGITVV